MVAESGLDSSATYPGDASERRHRPVWLAVAALCCALLAASIFLFIVTFFVLFDPHGGDRPADPIASILIFVAPIIGFGMLRGAFRSLAKVGYKSNAAKTALVMLFTAVGFPLCFGIIDLVWPMQ